MIRTLVLTAVCCLLGHTLLAQHPLQKAYDTLQSNTTLTRTERHQAISELLDMPQTLENEVQLGILNYRYARNLYQVRSFTEAIKYSQKAITIFKNYPDHKDNYLERSLSNLITFCLNAEYYYQGINAADHLLKVAQPESRMAGVAYEKKGRLLVLLGDYNQAVDCFKKAKLIIQKLYLKDDLSRVYSNTSTIYAHINDPKYLTNIQDLYKDFTSLDIPKRPNYELVIEYSIGSYYDNLGNYNSSIKFYKRALSIATIIGDSLNISKIQNGLGITYKKLGAKDTALQYYSKSLQYSQINNSLKTIIYDNIGNIYNEEKKYEKAIQTYQQAIKFLIPTTSQNYYELPELKKIASSSHKLYLLEAILDKAHAWKAWADETQNKSYYENALETFKLADQVLDLIYFESRESLSKVFWREKGAAMYRDAVALCHTLGRSERAVYFQEKGKTLLLLENITAFQASQLSGLPQAALERDERLRQSLSRMENQLEEVETGSTRDSMEVALITHKEHYRVFIDSLETSHPKYHTYKQGVAVNSVQEIQAYLRPEDLALQYSLTADAAYLSLIRKDHISLMALESRESLDSLLASYRERLTVPFRTATDKEAYQTAAYALYQHLFPKDIKTHQAQNLIIIPDGELQYIPFEALVNSDSTPLEEAYLLQQYTVQYAYSLSSLIQNSGQTHSDYEADLLHVVPTIFQDQRLAPLDMGSALEPGYATMAYTRERATKQQFKTAFGQHKIVNISTHGGLDNGQPWLAFYDDKLKVNELYFTNNQAQLVVLNACKTAQGKLQEGEGVMSIARGFINAGTPSVVSALWEVDLKASDEIINIFYKTLKTGTSKTAALQQAKLAYLDKHSNTSQASPYYWSAITLTGDAQPIPAKSGKLWVYLLISVIVLLGYMLIKKRNTAA